MSRVKMRHAKKKNGLGGVLWANRSAKGRVAVVTAGIFLVLALATLILGLCKPSFFPGKAAVESIKQYLLPLFVTFTVSTVLSFFVYMETSLAVDALARELPVRKILSALFASLAAIISLIVTFSLSVYLVTGRSVLNTGNFFPGEEATSIKDYFVPLILTCALSVLSAALVCSVVFTVVGHLLRKETPVVRGFVKSAAVLVLAILYLFGSISVSTYTVTGRAPISWWKFYKEVKEGLDAGRDEAFQELTPEELGVADDIHFPEGIKNIALFGIDSRSDNMKGLSDSMMILSIDGNNNNIKLISLQRDSLVPVERNNNGKYTWEKLTHAYSIGGATLAVKTINKVFKLNITDYATVDFVGMSSIIEAVGGIDTVMTEKEVDNANIQIKEMHATRGTPLDLIYGSGKLHLNGIQAVAYSRVRKADVHKDIAGDEIYDFGDYGRTLRQRYVMSQLFTKALDLKIGEYPEMIKALLPLMQTSLSESEVYDLAMILLRDGVQMQQERIPADKAIIRKGVMVDTLGSCEYYDLDYAADLLHAFLFENTTFDDYIEANGVRKNGSGSRFKFDTSRFTKDKDTSSTDSDEGDGEEDVITDTGTGTETESWVDRPSGNKGTGNKGTGSSGGGDEETTDTTDEIDTSDTEDTSDGSSTDSSDSDSSDSSDSTDSDSSDSDSSDKPPVSSDKPSSGNKPTDSDETSDKEDSSDSEE